MYILIVPSKLDRSYFSSLFWLLGNFCVMSIGFRSKSLWIFSLFLCSRYYHDYHLTEYYSISICFLRTLALFVCLTTGILLKIGNVEPKLTKKVLKDDDIYLILYLISSVLSLLLFMIVWKWVKYLTLSNFSSSIPLATPWWHVSKSL